MGFFSNMYTKEGPGVRKDAPVKKGLPRFFEIVYRDYWLLLRTNALALFCCVPALVVLVAMFVFKDYLGMVLIGFVLYLLCSLLVGPALCSALAIIITTVRDIPCFMMYEYKKAWKANFKQSSAVGVIMMALYAIEGFTLMSLFLSPPEGYMFYVLFGLVSFCLLLITAASILAFSQVLFIDLPLKNILKNSLLMVFAFAKRTIPAALLILTSAILIVLFVPMFLWFFIIILGIPGLIALGATMCTWPVMEQVFEITKKQKERDDEALQENN